MYLDQDVPAEGVLQSGGVCMLEVYFVKCAMPAEGVLESGWVCMLEVYLVKRGMSAEGVLRSGRCTKSAFHWQVVNS